MNQINTDIENQILSKDWFYSFKLPSGKQTGCYIGEKDSQIHDTRLQMMNSALATHLPKQQWEKTRCIDLACHQGYYAFELAKKNCEQVVGVDVRQQNVDDANMLLKAYSYNNMQFIVEDIFNLDTEALQTFDVVLVLGLLYHLENPIGALRIAKKLTKKICLIESQIGPNISWQVDWGNPWTQKQIMGTFSVVGEEYEHKVHREANLKNISLVPSLEALTWILKTIGFTRVEIITPPENAYEQLSTGNRIMLAAIID